MKERYYTDISLKMAIRSVCCTVVAIISLLGCRSDSSTSQNATPPPRSTATVGLLDSIKQGLNSATSEVNDIVSPRAAELQTLTKEEVKKLYQWEYFVDSVPLQISSADLQTKLANLGADRWECFSLSPVNEELRITCKRRPSSALSYLKCLSGI